MASGSVLTHTFSNPATSSAFQDLPRSSCTSDANTISQRQLYNTSHTASPTNDRQTSSDRASSSEAPSTQQDENMLPSESSVDADAEGSVDTDYAADAGLRHEIDTPSAARSNSEGASSGGKRKHTVVDDDDYMRNNPALYGLRRSARARTSHHIIDTSTDHEDSASDLDARPARKRRRGNSIQKSSKNASSRSSSPPSSDVDFDTYGGARARAEVRKQRRRQIEAAIPSQAEVRFSTRRAAKVANYKEDDDEDLDEFESDEKPANYEAVETTDDKPYIDAVLKHRVMTGVDRQSPLKEDLEFYIKWRGKAHYHATWEPWSALSLVGGFKRLKNYMDRIVIPGNKMAHDEGVPPEEKEKWSLDRERDADALLEYVQVERVIDTQEGEEETEYYVKWKSLPYSDCTWEPASLVSKLAQNEIDRYLDRSTKLPVSNRLESNLQTRSAYQPFREQPSYIKNGELREFQIKGVNFLAHSWCNGDNVILADEMGLGKTVQTISFMSWLMHERQQQGPFLVVVPLSTMPSWAETFNHWTPDINYVVYSGTDSARTIIRETELFVDRNPRKIKFNVLLTTYEFAMADAIHLSQLKWQFMAVDEAHRLKNRESKLYAKLMDFGAPSRLLITGTPVQNNLEELSALMNFLMPGKIDVDDIDLQSEAASRKLAELTASISPYMIRRTKQKVESDLPPKTEKIIRVELSDVQLEYYKNILTRNYAALNQGSKGHKQSLLNIMMELKKASNHPFMFPGVEDRLVAGSERREDTLKALITSSGKLMLLDQLLTKLKKDGHRVLIFSQMVRMLDILADYLHLRGHQYQRLDGTVAAAPRRMAIDHFNAPSSNDFCFLLSTRAGGLGINLMTADTVILFDSDWNPQADLQAMARAHRIGQKNPVTIYRLVSKDTVEEEVLERARNKLMLEFITIQRGVTDKDAKERSDAWLKAGHIGEPDSSDDITRILKRRGQKMFEQSGNQKKLEELDIDAVLESAEEHKTEQLEALAADGGEDFLKSFDYTDVKIDLEWDEIIPKNELEKIHAEEKKKEDEKYLAAIQEQNAPRKRKAPQNEEREQRAAKKRARDLAAVDAAEEDEDDSDSDADPKRPLTETEIRNLIRGYERYGSIDLRQEELIKDAKLVGRDVEMLRATLREVMDISEQAIKQEKDRLSEIERDEHRAITKKDKKAVLFDYHGVKRLNAETLIERPLEMQLLQDVTSDVSDWKSFRVPEATKAPNYTAQWGAREDGMLCVGIAKHGYGAWVAIRDDPDLGMGDKFYLEEHRVDQKEERKKADDSNVRSPGAVHLVRRINYLLSVLKDKTNHGTHSIARKSIENHHRNTKKLATSNKRLETPAHSASPQPNGVRKPLPRNQAEKMRNRLHGHNEHRQQSHRPTPDRHTASNHKAERHSVSREDAGGLNNRRRNGNNNEREEKHERRFQNEKQRKREREHEGENEKPLAQDGTENINKRRKYTHGGAKEQESNVRNSNENEKPQRPRLEKENSRRKDNSYAGERGNLVRAGEKQKFNKSARADKEKVNGKNGEAGKARESNGHGSPAMASPNNKVQPDAVMEDFFRPAGEGVALLRNYAKLPPEARVSALKESLGIIEAHITHAALRKGASFEKDCWDYVATRYWPNKGASKQATGEGLQKMARKLVEKGGVKLKTLSTAVLTTEKQTQQAAATAISDGIVAATSSKALQ